MVGWKASVHQHVGDVPVSWASWLWLGDRRIGQICTKRNPSPSEPCWWGHMGICRWVSGPYHCNWLWWNILENNKPLQGMAPPTCLSWAFSWAHQHFSFQNVLSWALSLLSSLRKRKNLSQVRNEIWEMHSYYLFIGNWNWCMDEYKSVSQHSQDEESQGNITLTCVIFLCIHIDIVNPLQYPIPNLRADWPTITSNYVIDTSSLAIRWVVAARVQSPQISAHASTQKYFNLIWQYSWHGWPSWPLWERAWVAACFRSLSTSPPLQSLMQSWTEGADLSQTSKNFKWKLFYLFLSCFN